MIDIQNIKVNNTASNRVLLANFDNNWKRKLSDGHVVYIAKSDNAVVTLILVGSDTQTLMFKEDKRIFVVGKTFHFPPHIQVLTS